MESLTFIHTDNVLIYSLEIWKRFLASKVWKYTTVYTRTLRSIARSSPRYPISSLHTIINFNDLRLYPPGNLIRRRDHGIRFVTLQVRHSISSVLKIVPKKNYVIIYLSPLNTIAAEERSSKEEGLSQSDKLTTSRIGVRTQWISDAIRKLRIARSSFGEIGTWEIE